jgi:hypothetical protein
MTDTIQAGSRCITLTDRWGHDLMICELPPDLSDDEVRRLHGQILACFSTDLAAAGTHPGQGRVLSWPEVVERLAQQRRPGCPA